jgi:hypothetical protein
MKVKRYFHLRDDIYEYISIHWDVICRRERIKNWRHTIGMTLSHYQNLFQNGYHIYQNTGYWSMKDTVPNPYAIDPLIDQSPGGEKKRLKPNPKHTNSPPPPADHLLRDTSAPVVGATTTTTTSSNNNNNNHNNNNINNININNMNNDENDDLNKSTSDRDDSFSKLSPTLPPSPHTPSSSQAFMHSSGFSPAVRFDEMKGEIDRFKKEMGALQSEIDALQEQLQIKKAEEHLLKFLQEGISSFRDKIRQRIELLRTEMITNHSEHQQQIHSMASELTQLREIGADLRNAFQYQFARLAQLNSASSPRTKREREEERGEEGERGERDSQVHL